MHISITNPSLDSPLPYFRGKAILEKEIRASGISHAIVRPTVLFGKEDILINNITYLLRRLPVFAIPGSGDYRLQPIYVEDLAEIAVEAWRELGIDTVVKPYEVNVYWDEYNNRAWGVTTAISPFYSVQDAYWMFDKYHSKWQMFGWGQNGDIGYSNPELDFYMENNPSKK